VDMKSILKIYSMVKLFLDYLTDTG
jgi:hypothetical protein